METTLAATLRDFKMKLASRELYVRNGICGCKGEIKMGVRGIAEDRTEHEGI